MSFSLIIFDYDGVLIGSLGDAISIGICCRDFLSNQINRMIYYNKGTKRRTF